MATTTRRTTITLPAYMLTDLGYEAKRRGTTVSKLVEGIVEPALYHPNAETLAAIEEARSGVELPKVDLSSVEAMTKSILG